MSSAILSTDAGTAAQYNNLRLDLLGHLHSGGTTPVPHLLNTKYLEAENASAATKSILGVDASNVLQIGASGLTVTITGVTTLTNPKIVTALNDTNGNPVVVPTATGSAVNGVGITNGATGTGPTVTVDGPSVDTNADLILSGRGTGKVKASATYGAITADSDGATITFNLATSNFHGVTLGGNRTLAVSNASTGQRFFVRLLQDGTGTRTVTWWSTIKWAGGSAPTLTTTASKADLLAFVCTGSNTYDGFVVGQNL